MKKAKPAAIADQPRLTPEQYKAVAKYKGWSWVTLAKRWGYTPVWVGEIARDAARPLRYDDALHGLPNLNWASHDLARRAKQINRALGDRKKIVPASVPDLGPGYRYRGYLMPGSIVTASAMVGSMAEEGMRGIVFQVVDQNNFEAYGIIFETGLWDWFPPDYIDNSIASTGLMDEPIQTYRYLDEQALQADYEQGFFTFW